LWSLAAIKDEELRIMRTVTTRIANGVGTLTLSRVDKKKA